MSLSYGLRYSIGFALDLSKRGISLKGASSMPISITTVLDGPYRLDDDGEDGILTYAYRGQDPDHRDNRGLREAMRTRTPITYFKRIHNRRYA